MLMYLKKYFKKIMICALLLAFAAPASSELFQYTDENGITRLTNNIYSVPAKDRHRLEPFSDFTPLTSEIKIQKFQKKSAPLPAVEKVIHPKTFKTQPYETARIIPPLQKKVTADDETPKQATAPEPAPTIKKEKSLEMPPDESMDREPHQSRQVMIEKTPPDIKKDPVAKTPEKGIAPLVKIPSAQTDSKLNIQQSKGEKTVHEPFPTIEKPTHSREIAQSALPAQIAEPVKKTAPEPKSEPMHLDTKKSAHHPSISATAEKSTPLDLPPDSKVAAGSETGKQLMDATKKSVSDKQLEIALKTETAGPEKEKSASLKPAPIIHKAPPAPADPVPEQRDVPKTAPAETSIKEYAAVDKRTLPGPPTSMEKPSDPVGQETATSDDPAGKALIETPQQDPPLDLALLENTQKRLIEKKKTLNLKFQSLMQEKQEIESNVDENDEESVLAYNERVKKLNIKIKEYNLEKKILQVQIEKYNHDIERLTAN